MGLDMYFHKGPKIEKEDLRQYNLFLDDLERVEYEIISEIEDFGEDGHFDEEVIMTQMSIEMQKYFPKYDMKKINEIEDMFVNIENLKHFRKVYDVHSYINQNNSDQLGVDDNCRFMVLYKEELEEILEFVQMIKKEDDWDDNQEVESFLLKALEDLDKEKEALYYSVWY